MSSGRFKIGLAFEKRDWGGVKPTWRPVPPTMKRYHRGTSGRSLYAVRIVSRKLAKKLQFAGDVLRAY